MRYHIGRSSILGLGIFFFLSSTFAADLASMSFRLAKQAEELAMDSYRGFSNRDRGNRADVEILFLVQQFGSGANLFRRMVEDRRPVSELRSACDLLKLQSRDFSDYPFGRQRTSDIQRLLDEIARELNVSDNPFGRGPDSQARDVPPGRDTSGTERMPPQRNPSGQGPIGRPGPGKLVWAGRVDNEIHVQVSGSRVFVQLIQGQDVQNMRQEFSGSLPGQEISVSLKKKKGRGSVQIFEQPSRANGYQAVVRIQDPKGGDDDYEFELTW